VLFQTGLSPFWAPCPIYCTDKLCTRNFLSGLERQSPYFKCVKAKTSTWKNNTKQCFYTVSFRAIEICKVNTSECVYIFRASSATLVTTIKKLLYYCRIFVSNTRNKPRIVFFNIRTIQKFNIIMKSHECTI